MRALAAPALLGLSLTASACSEAATDEPPRLEPALAWSRALGTDGDDFGRAIAADSDGSLYVAGYSEGAFEGAQNAGSWDAFLARLDAAGGLTWTREWGGDGEELAQAVVSDDAGHVYVAGYTSSSLAGDLVGGHDVFLSMYGADGADGWTRQWGSDADEYVTAAARAPTGVIVAGYTKGAFEGFENQGRDDDAFVMLCDDDGTRRWTRQFGSQETDYAQAVHVDAAGNVLLAGYTAGRLGDDADLGAEDAFLLALNPDGEQLFLRQWGSPTTDYALGVASDASGNLYVTGYTYGSVSGEASIAGEDGYVTKLDATGAFGWTRQFGTLSRDSARFVNVDADGDVLVGGDTEGAFAKDISGGKRDAFIVRFDAGGAETFRGQWGGSASEFMLAAAAANSALFLAGYVEPGDGSRDAFLSRWSF